MIKSKLTVMAVVFSILLGFTVAFAQTTDTTTVSADQVKAALDKFTAARNEYQSLVKSGADQAAIDSARIKFESARIEYQKLNQAAGNCTTPGSGKKNNKNGNAQGNGLKKRDGSCGQIPSSISGQSQNNSSMGMGKGRGNGKGRSSR